MNKKFASDLFLLVISQVAVWYGVKWAIGQLDPMRKKKDESRATAEKILGRLKLEQESLNEYEHIIAADIIHPEDIDVGFGDVEGLDDIIQSLKESVLYPLTVADIFGKSANPRLLGPPKGVLLYGPPGCGKTLLAKALARESGAVFINLHLSTLTEKWYGESQKLVKAVFSLAKKLQPTIIFIDEIDSFLRSRQSNDHEVTGMMKAEFMSLWDGLNSDSNDRIMILGASNRIQDIDSAFLRRMPQRFFISYPELEERFKILALLLTGVSIDNREAVVREVALATSGLSGSDLKEICRNALLTSMHEYMNDKMTNESAEEVECRPLTIEDFERALKSSRIAFDGNY